MLGIRCYALGIAALGRRKYSVDGTVPSVGMQSYLKEGIQVSMANGSLMQ